jgi:hypothetical protein
LNFFRDACILSCLQGGLALSRCDCSETEVTEAHIRERIARIEQATRFRPVHIRVLLLDSAPAANPNDDFYRPAPDRSVRSLISRMFFDELAVASGISRDSLSSVNEAGTLADFQRRGFFLAHVVECPIAERLALRHTINRLAPSLIRRLDSSFKPKFVVPVGSAIGEIVPFLQMSKWKDRLILAKDSPFEDPFLGDPQNQAEFGTYLGDALARAIPASP